MHEFPLGEGTALRYLDLPGEGLPILYIHGLGCAGSADYPEVAASPVLRGHRALIVDRPGFGFSDHPAGYDYSVSGQARTLAGFVETLGISRLVVYGHSAGGSIAIELADALPADTLAALVICEGNLDSGGGVASRALAAAGRTLGPELSAVSALPEPVIAEAAGDASGWAALLRLAHPAAVVSEALSLVSGGQPPWRDQLYALAARVPTTYIFGELTLPDPDLTELPQHGVGVRVVPGVGHNMAWEDPGALAEAIASCLSARTTS